MLAVCDTCSIIKLRKGRVIDCLGLLFYKVYIPPAVQAECVLGTTWQVLEQPFFEVRTVQNVLPLGMGQGEREAISLAVELGITTLITDDEKAFRNAVRQGLQPVRVFDLLVYAKQVGAITSVKAVLDAMKQQNEGIREDLYQQTLKDAGESPA